MFFENKLTEMKRSGTYKRLVNYQKTGTVRLSRTSLIQNPEKRLSNLMIVKITPFSQVEFSQVEIFFFLESRIWCCIWSKEG